MINSKLIRLLKSFTTDEVKELKSFVSSPFFNTNPSIKKLYEVLLPAYPKFEEHAVGKEYVYDQVYPNKSFNSGGFRNLVSDFTKLVQEYLKQLELRKRTELQDRLLLSAYSEKLLKRDFNDLYTTLEKEFEKKPPQDSEQFLTLFLLLKEYYHHPETNRREMDASFPSKILSSLNHFFILSKLQMAIEVASRKEVLKEEAPTFFFKHHIAQYAASNAIKVKPLLDILLCLEHFYTEPSPKLLEQAKGIFKNHHLEFSPFDKKMILTVLINQMNYLFQLGDAVYLEEMHEMYEFAVYENILLYGNRFVPFDFINIVTTASRNKKTDWAWDFIDDYKAYLPEKEKDQIVALAEATVHYDLGKYNTVTEVLTPYSFRKSPLGLRFRFISIKAYVELVFQDLKRLQFTSDFIQRMEQYIKRGSKNKATKQSIGFANFLKIVKLIVKECETRDKRNIVEIRTMTNKLSPVIAKNWLLQKIKDLEQL